MSFGIDVLGIGHSNTAWQKKDFWRTTEPEEGGWRGGDGVSHKLPLVCVLHLNLVCFLSLRFFFFTFFLLLAKS